MNQAGNLRAGRR